MSTIVTRSGKGSALTWAEADANFTNLNNEKAPLDSPALTGTPTAPTATSGTNTTQIASTAFVQEKTATQTPFTATGNLAATNVQSAIAELDTEKVAKAGDTMTGTLRTPNSQIGTSATTTENHFWDGSVANQITLKRGTPDAPGTTVIQVVNGKVTALPNAQTWQDMTASRTWDTNYTNNTLQPITVSIRCSATLLQYSDILVDGNVITTAQSAVASGNVAIAASAVVPVGATYRFEGTATMAKVWELR